MDVQRTVARAQAKRAAALSSGVCPLFTPAFLSRVMWCLPLAPRSDQVPASHQQQRAGADLPPPTSASSLFRRRRVTALHGQSNLKMRVTLDPVTSRSLAGEHAGGWGDATLTRRLGFALVCAQRQLSDVCPPPLVPRPFRLALAWACLPLVVGLLQSAALSACAMHPLSRLVAGLCLR